MPRLIGCAPRLATALWLAMSACAPSGPGPDPCPSAIAAAESVYLECAEALGLEVRRLDLTESGDIDVEFGDGYTPETAELARRDCEPPMQETLALGLLACTAVDPGHPADAETLKAQLDEIEQSGFSGSVSIVRDGEVVVARGMGLADREREIPNAPDTAFDYGSIMKVMTAVAVLQLEADGALSRSATLGELLAGVPADKSAITVGQVLQHRAGLQEFHDTEGDFEPMDRATALERILAQPLLFAPGEDTSYSNSGYTLLAAIVEDASGAAFTERLRARIFEPAGMTRSGLYGEGLWPEGTAAIGYEEDAFGCNSPGCWPAPSWALLGNGGLVSTVEDLQRFGAALDAGTLLPEALREALRRDVLGTRDIRIDGEPAYAFSGRNDFGFGASMGAVPSRSTRVVVATNAAPTTNDTIVMATLLQLALGAFVEID